MKKLLLFIGFGFLMFNYSYGQYTVGLDTTAIGLGATSGSPFYKFQYGGNSVPYYGLGWFNDSAFTGGPMAYLTGYGGIKFFTNGTPKSIIDFNGKFGIGTLSPVTLLDVKLATNQHVQFAANVNGSYTGASGIVCQNDANTGYTPLGFYASNFYFGGGNVLVGKTSQINTAYILDVNGNVRANEVVVNTSGADFVFDHSYHLSSLSNLKKYIEHNHHLPEMASAKQMQANGLNLGNNQIKLLQKVEEMTLYLIEKDKEIKDQSAQLKSQQDQINTLIKQVAELSKIK